MPGRARRIFAERSLSFCFGGVLRNEANFAMQIFARGEETASFTKRKPSLPVRPGGARARGRGNALQSEVNTATFWANSKSGRKWLVCLGKRSLRGAVIGWERRGDPRQFGQNRDDLFGRVARELEVNPNQLHPVRRAGKTIEIGSLILMRGSSSVGPNWHQPTAAEPSYTRAA